MLDVVRRQIQRCEPPTTPGFPMVDEIVTPRDSEEVGSLQGSFPLNSELPCMEPGAPRKQKMEPGLAAS